MIKKIYQLLLFLIIDLYAFSSISTGNYIQQNTSTVKNNSSANFAPTKVDPSYITITKPNPNPTPPPLQKVEKPTTKTPPIKLQNNIPAALQKPVVKTNDPTYNKLLEENNIADSIQKKELESERSEMKRRLNKKDEDSSFVKQLSGLNYKTQTPPKKLYNRNYSPTNKHLPPVYFKSYYLYMALIQILLFLLILYFLKLYFHNIYDTYLN